MTLLTKLLMKSQQLKRKQTMKTTAKKTTMLLSATVLMTTMTFTSCTKESELDTIKDAQMCLNTATTATAQSCVSKLAAINTEQASQLKCAAYFIQEGYGTPTKLIEAIEAAESGGGDSTMNMISELSFSSSAQSSAAFEVCNGSGIAVYSQLSSLVQISTLAKALDPTAVSPAEFSAAVGNIPASVLGDLVETTYASSCSSQSGSGEALQEFCGELGEALSENSAADVGTCLKYKLGAAAYPGLPCPN